MPRYLISFDDGAMDHIHDEDWPAVGEASHAVVREAKTAGVWVFGGGLRRQRTTRVGVDGTVSEGALPFSKAMVGASRWSRWPLNRRRCTGQPGSPPAAGAPRT